MSSSHHILTALNQYIDDWEELERQYYQIPRIPIYHFIMQMRNINARGRLTKEFEAKSKRMGLTQ